MEGAGALMGRTAELAAAGLVRPPALPLDPTFADAARPHDPAGRSLESILEERAEGW